ncbi:MAG: 4'-phosphopantetheinyl transferase family protein [Acidobacteriaceae bacterium]
MLWQGSLWLSWSFFAPWLDKGATANFHGVCSVQRVSYIPTTWRLLLREEGLLDAGRGSVRIVLWPVSFPVSPACWRLLDAEEQRRANAFLRQEHRERFVAAHCGVRRLLANALGCGAGQVRFLADGIAKPRLAEADIHFNLTHSGNWAALAISRDCEVGLDLEQVRPVERSLPQHYFSSQEQAALALSGANDEEWLAGFFRCWTRKEALLKAVGAGLSLPLDAFTVTLQQGLPATLLSSSLDVLQPRDWRLFHLDCLPGHIGALAACGHVQRVTVLVISGGEDGEAAAG